MQDSNTNISETFRPAVRYWRQIRWRWLIAGVIVMMGACIKREPRPAGPVQERPVGSNVRGMSLQPSATIPQLNLFAGHVATVNVERRFVVIDCGVQAPPSAGRRLEIWRAGKPVGEVRVSGPVRGRFVTADVLVGEPQVDDEVR